MPTKIINIKDADDNDVAVPFARVAAGATSNTYCNEFAKIPINTSGTGANASFLVGNVGGTLYANKGLYYIQYLNRNSTLSITVQQLGTITGYAYFGYTTGNDGYYHLYVYRSATYGSSPRISIVNQLNGYYMELVDSTSTADPPADWVKINQLGTYRVDRQTNINGIAGLKAQLTAWADQMETSSAGFFMAQLASAVSPFTYTRIAIQLYCFDVAGYAVAVLFQYRPNNTAGADMFLMSYTANVWTDPVKITN